MRNFVNPPATRSLTTILALLFAIGGLTGCSLGGGDDPPPTPLGEFRGGGADASVTVGAETFAYEDGICEKPSDGRFIVVNIGNPAADDYFGLVAGRHPGLEGATKTADEGGVFEGDSQARINLRHNSQVFLLQGARTVVTLDAGGSSGTFTGELTRSDDAGNAIEVSGTFTCPENAPTPAATPE